MRLLLAEDEEDLSRALVAVLKHNNYSVDAVYDGAEALDYIENGDNYDGIILDIMMPKMDGITVLKTIRSHGNPVPRTEKYHWKKKKKQIVTRLILMKMLRILKANWMRDYL